MKIDKEKNEYSLTEIREIHFRAVEKDGKWLVTCPDNYWIWGSAENKEDAIKDFMKRLQDSGKDIDWAGFWYSYYDLSPEDF